jgi:hypothetical protein
MDLEQLKNLGDILTGSAADGDYLGDRPVKVMDSDDYVHDVLSVNWSSEHQCFIIIGDYEDDDL